MIGIWGAQSNLYLYILGVATLILFGLPMVFVPMQWARALRWELPQPSDLAITFGRSLGIVISIVAIFAIRVAQIPAAKPFFFDMLIAIFAGMLLIHVYGAIRKTQPFTETGEIALWVLLGLLTLSFYPVP